MAENAPKASRAKQEDGAARDARAADRPPRAASSSQKTDAEKINELIHPPATKRSPADRKLAEAISGTYTTIGAVVIGVGMRFEDKGITGVGVETINQADPLAEAWLDLGDRNPKVKAWMKRVTEASAAGVVIGLHIALLTPLLIDRGIIPEGMPNIFTGNPAANGTPLG